MSYQNMIWINIMLCRTKPVVILCSWDFFFHPNGYIVKEAFFCVKSIDKCDARVDVETWPNLPRYCDLLLSSFNVHWFMWERSFHKVFVHDAAWNSLNKLCSSEKLRASKSIISFVTLCRYLMHHTHSILHSMLILSLITVSMEKMNAIISNIDDSTKAACLDTCRTLYLEALL